MTAQGGFGVGSGKYFGPHVITIEAAIGQSGGTVPADVLADIQQWMTLNQLRTGLDALVYLLLLLAVFVRLRPRPA